MPEVALLNLFPANVRLPDGEQRTVRVVVTADKARVYGLVGSVPTLVAEADVANYRAAPTGARRSIDPAVVETADGQTWEISRAKGCGCGNKLKSFNPFAGPARIGS